MNVEVPLAPKKRKRSELEGKSTSSKASNSQLYIINNLIRFVNKLTQSIDSIELRNKVVGILSRK